MGTVVGEFVAPLVRVSLADAVPGTFGINLTVAATLCPAGIVTGNTKPGSVNSELFTCAEEMVTGPLTAESVSCRLAGEFTVTLPKLRLEGVTPSVTAFTATPVPQTFMTSFGFFASLTS